MSTVGSLARDPGIVSLSIASSAVTILRGQMVTVDSGTHTARLANAVGDKIFGVALSDADPDSLNVSVGCKGGYTISMAPIAGQTFNVGTLVYQDSTNFAQVTAVVGTNLLLGWCVNGQPDSLGNIEVAFFIP